MRLQSVSGIVTGLCAASLVGFFGAGPSNAQATASTQEMPAEVQKSQVESRCDSVSQGSSFCYLYHRLAVLVGGRHLELEGKAKYKDGIIALGTYQIRLKTDEHKRPYLSYMVYELKFPDGTTEDFAVVGESK